MAPDGVGEDDVAAVPIPDEEGVLGRRVDHPGGLHGRRVRCWFPGRAMIGGDFEAPARDPGELSAGKFDER